jgi:hypothetical protein
MNSVEGIIAMNEIFTKQKGYKIFYTPLLEVTMDVILNGNLSKSFIGQAGAVPSLIPIVLSHGYVSTRST